MPYASVDDLVKRWRTLTPAEAERATVLLEDAATRLDAACAPSDPITDQEKASRLIVSVDMVKRAMLSGSGDGGPGVESRQQGAGPYQETVKYANPTGDLYITKADRDLLGCGAQEAFTVSMADWSTGPRPDPWGIL